jgi:hypothetical protein
VDRAPKLDGTLNDPLWQEATPITNFLQREPYEGEPPTERTEVRVLYTKHAVYFGIACLDSDPRKIVATELRRDATQPNTYSGCGHVPSTTCFLYTTSTNSWSVTGSLNQARIDHTSTLLPNGKVLVAGGLDRTLSAGFTILSSAELYTP